MFTSSGKYRELQRKHINLQDELTLIADKYFDLLGEWNELVGKINKKGGDSFLNGDDNRSQFSVDEIKKLITLCHPDKHGGSSISNEITARLNEIRNSEK